MRKLASSRMGWMMAPVAALAIAAAPRPAGAITSDEIWPEVDLFYSFNDTTRLMLLAEARIAPVSGLAAGELGARIEKAVVPLRARLFPTIEVSRRERATLAFGYQGGGALGGSFGGASRENRVLAEATFRLLLPAEILASDRNRFEGRRLDGDWSGRYRNRLELVRGFDWGHVTLDPKANVEVFYDTRAADWTRLRVEAGVDVEQLTGRGTVIQLYFVRQYDRSQPTVVDAVGVTFAVYR